jgi:hypothetical protein
MLEYIKHRQKQLEARTRRAAELEAKKEAERLAIIEAEAREQEEIAARKKLLLEQQEAERLRQKHIQRKEKLAEQKWNEQLDTLLTQVDQRRREDDKLEEIRIIIQNREPSLEELGWASWLLSSPLNQKLADLDFERALEMFKRDNLMAKRRSRRRGNEKYIDHVVSFTGDGASGAEEYVTTDFNPDDYNLNLGFTVSYWVRPDEVGTNMFAFGRKHSNSERFVFGISQANKIHIGTGGNKLTGRWDTGLSDNPSGDTAVELFPSLFDDGDLKTGNWLHFAVTYADRTSTADGSVARKVYLNGELIRSQNVNWSVTGGGTGGMYFGARNLTTVGYNYGWACGLSQVAIFDTAKDADWVENVYNTNGPRESRTRGTKLVFTGQSGLVGYWKFNEGSGNTVTDHSGNGNHGTFADISGDTTDYPAWEKS